MNEKLVKKTDESIKKILDEGITTSNLDHLYKLSKINHIAKEDESMNYGNYGNYGRGSYGRDSYGRERYGEYDEYGARRRDSRGRYRGHDYIDRMYDDYGRYMESRDRYGAGEETDKSYHYMVKALEDFIKVLHEEAETPQQKQQLMQALQNSMR